MVLHSEMQTTPKVLVGSVETVTLHLVSLAARGFPKKIRKVYALITVNSFIAIPFFYSSFTLSMSLSLSLHTFVVTSERSRKEQTEKPKKDSKQRRADRYVQVSIAQSSTGYQCLIC